MTIEDPQWGVELTNLGWHVAYVLERADEFKNLLGWGDV